MSRIGQIARRIRKASGSHFWVQELELLPDGDGFNAQADSADRVVRVTTELAAALTDDELAFVIAHEFAHFEMDHHKQTVDLIDQKLNALKEVLSKMDARAKSRGAGFLKRAGAQIAGVGLGAGALYLAARLQSQDHETEADEKALEIMHKAGFDPDAAVSALAKLHGGYIPDVGFLRSLTLTHPAPDSRARRLASTARELKGFG